MKLRYKFGDPWCNLFKEKTILLCAASQVQVGLLLLLLLLCVKMSALILEKKEAYKTSSKGVSTSLGDMEERGWREG